MNLLKETKEILKENGKTLDDVIWIGSYTEHLDIELFKGLANVEYDDGFGSAEVPEELFIVGYDWWLERHEYDGSECWEYKSIPIKPSKKITPTRLIRQRYESLKDMDKSYED